MARISPKNLYVRSVQDGGRKSCPSCKTKLNTLKDPYIYAIGEYIRAKWHNAVDRCCEACFSTHIRDIIHFSQRNGRPVQFQGKGEKLPWFIADPLIFADHLEEQGKTNTARLYRDLEKVLWSDTKQKLLDSHFSTHHGNLYHADCPECQKESGEKLVQIVLDDYQELHGAKRAGKYDVPVYDDGYGPLWLYLDSCGAWMNPARVTRAKSWEDAFSIAHDEMDSIPQEELPEAYRFEKGAEPEGFHHFGFNADNQLAAFDKDGKELFVPNNFNGGWDKVVLCEGYHYQDNSSGTGVIRPDDNERLDPLTPALCEQHELELDIRHSMDVHFIKGYLNVACTLSNPDHNAGDPVMPYHLDNLTAEAKSAIEKDCIAFLKGNRAMIVLEDQGYWPHDIAQYELAGYCFWMSRNGEGVGFFDHEEFGQHCDALQSAAKKFGEASLYIGDDGKLYYFNS